MKQKSGQYKGLRIIQSGRHQVRSFLYMAMMSAIQSNPVFKKRISDELPADKPKKVAIIVYIRKTAVMLNSILIKERDNVGSAKDYKLASNTIVCCYITIAEHDFQ